MRKYWLSILGSLVLVLIVPLLSVLQTHQIKGDRPQAVQGVIDLRSWDARHDGIMKLDGEWELYRDVLLSPGDFHPVNAGKEVPAPSTMIQVPGKWNDDISEQGERRAKGYATYRLQAMIAPGEDMVYGLRTSNIRSASKVYLNGQEIGSSGTPAASASEGRQNNMPLWDSPR